MHRYGGTMGPGVVCPVTPWMRPQTAGRPSSSPDWLTGSPLACSLTTPVQSDHFETYLYATLLTCIGEYCRYYLAVGGTTWHTTDREKVFETKATRSRCAMLRVCSDPSLSFDSISTSVLLIPVLSFVYPKFRQHIS